MFKNITKFFIRSAAQRAQDHGEENTHPRTMAEIHMINPDIQYVGGNPSKPYRELVLHLEKQDETSLLIPAFISPQAAGYNQLDDLRTGDKVEVSQAGGGIIGGAVPVIYLATLRIANTSPDPTPSINPPS